MKIRALTVLLAATALVLGTALPSQAATKTYKDKANDLKSGLDLRKVKVRNTSKTLVIKSLHKDLRASSYGGVAFWIDTKKSRKGPEYLVAGGTGDGTDWNMFRARKWKTKGEPLNCTVKMKTSWKRDTAIFRISRKCLGKYSKIRVAAEAGLDSRVDYGPSKHRFYPWLKRG